MKDAKDYGKEDFRSFTRRVKSFVLSESVYHPCLGGLGNLGVRLNYEIKANARPISTGGSV